MIYSCPSIACTGKLFCKKVFHRTAKTFHHRGTESAKGGKEWNGFWSGVNSESGVPPKMNRGSELEDRTQNASRAILALTQAPNADLRQIPRQGVESTIVKPLFHASPAFVPSVPLW